MKKDIRIIGAREHNLKNIDVVIPRKQLSVVTGLSGSGKSSLIFDTLYAEGQRRFMETLSTYAKQFIGGMNRPDVDKIEGLSPVIAIEQKTVNRNPRSTVGTTTEIYDLLRVLYARASTAYSYKTEQPMISHTSQQILELIYETYQNQPIYVLAPLVVARKGHYKELFAQYYKKGYSQVRLDGKVLDLDGNLKADRFKTHDIELVVDKIIPKQLDDKRFVQSVHTALNLGQGVLQIMDKDGKTRFFSRHLMCSETGISYPNPDPNTFSFNSKKGACENCKGLGSVSVLNMEAVIPNPSISLAAGAIVPIGNKKKFWAYKQLEYIAQKYKFKMTTPFDEIPDKGIKAIMEGEYSTNKIKDEEVGITRTLRIDFEGLNTLLVEGEDVDDKTTLANKKFLKQEECKVCKGDRLRKESLYFRINGQNIAQTANSSMLDFKEWLKGLSELESDSQKGIVVREIGRELNSRLDIILNLGLGYLSLNRQSQTLSGGESQRLRLASQIGMQLVDATYILDEPSIGLHQRDNHKLIQSLRQLTEKDNTVIVVEHDKDIMLEADYLIDIGPKAGLKGGNLVFQGDREAMQKTDSVTLDYVLGRKEISIPAERRKAEQFLELKGARGHNLKKVDLSIPLGSFVCITGVSGSGKSSLINQTLYPILRNKIYKTKDVILPYDSLTNADEIDKIIKVDQQPIGRTPRSNPATYTDVFTHIRKLFASTVASKIKGFTPTTFSYNMKQGRCQTCEGKGKRLIQMRLIPDVYVECNDCNGKRYKSDVLEVKYKGKSISDVLDMTINAALEFFENITQIRHKIQTLQDVGLGYITLGQSSTTFSGGEAQRIKLAAELSKKDTKKTMYVLDEPTTGLHHKDIDVLLGVLQKLVDKGNTVVVIEHNMDVIKCADWIVDIGPESGKDGGEVIAQGTPEEICAKFDTETVTYLRKELNQE